MNAEELKAAAERRKKLQSIPGDTYGLADFAEALLSPGHESITALQAYLDTHTEPVTAEWLRETWGWKADADGRSASHGVFWWWRWGELLIGTARFKGVTTQAKFTMLMLPLGLQPKTKENQ